MRVLVYGMSSDKLGGIETFLLNMNAHMSDNMVFDYVLEGTDTIHSKAIREKGGKIYFIASKRQMIKNIKAWKTLLKEYKKNSNIIYFNMFSMAWSIPIYICRSYGYKVIVHAHNNKLHDCGVMLKALHAINRKVLEHMNILRFTNSGLSTAFFFGKKEAQMIYNAIDTSQFRFDGKKRDEIRKRLNLEENHVYGFSGRIMYQKNPLFLLKIFSEIRKRDKLARFIVCGDGNLMEQARAKDREFGTEVLFMGNVLDIQDYYQVMDCYILPSRFEGLGIVLIEAQCAGLPCVASADVIPRDAKITELLEFVPLRDNPGEWADICVRKCACPVVDRISYSEAVGDSPFEIKREARRLERMLRKAGK